MIAIRWIAATSNRWFDNLAYSRIRQRRLGGRQ